MATKGTYPNPAFKPCWETCQACFRCAAKGDYMSNYHGCSGCSGRFDLNGVTDPHEDDQCRCTEGVLQFVKANGEMRQVKYKSNPFEGSVHTNTKTEDERDWEAYVKNLRERFQDETYSPLEVSES